MIIKLEDIYKCTICGAIWDKSEIATVIIDNFKRRYCPICQCEILEKIE